MSFPEFPTEWGHEPESDDGEEASRCPPDDGSGANGAAVWRRRGESHAYQSRRGKSNISHVTEKMSFMI